MEKVLTVSIAAYNAEQYIVEVVNSVIRAKRRDAIEVFVIDDGGTDGTLAIAQQFEKDYPGIVYALHKENGGWGSTVNYALARARGRYFRLLDADDSFDTRALDALLVYLARTEADLVISPYMGFDDRTGRKLYEVNNDPFYQEDVAYRFPELSRGLLLSMHAYTVRTALARAAGVRCREKCLYRDIEFAARCLAASETVSFFSRIVYCYRKGREGQSVSRTAFLKHRREHEELIFDVLSIAEGVEDEARQALILALAEKAATQQYRIYYYVPPQNSLYDELRRFDSRLRREYPRFYKQYEPPKPINFFQKMNFHGYHLICCRNFFGGGKA